ncbi:DUF3017 domain-containing protein [Streptomyces sp. NPDC000229]|uniref:DUF3017 domain-containing protein n=1 Tax=Streptomyces sp. NPDC000229 TaxID=3154247 RepID=UPI0033229C02
MGVRANDDSATPARPAAAGPAAGGRPTTGGSGAASGTADPAADRAGRTVTGSPGTEASTPARPAAEPPAAGPAEGPAAARAADARSGGDEPADAPADATAGPRPAERPADEPAPRSRTDEPAPRSRADGTAARSRADESRVAGEEGPRPRVSRRPPTVTRDTARPEGGGRAAPGDAPAPARQWPLLTVLGLTALGLLIVGFDPFPQAPRIGAMLIGLALLTGAALRRVLPSVGMLAVRSRFTDMAAYGVLGASIVLLSLMTQPSPWLEIPFLEDAVRFAVR